MHHCLADFKRFKEGTAKRNLFLEQNQSHLDRTNLVNKGFIVWPKRELFLAGTKREILSGQDRSILPAPIANQNTGFASSCPLADSAI